MAIAKRRQCKSIFRAAKKSINEEGSVWMDSPNDLQAFKHIPSKVRTYANKLFTPLIVFLIFHPHNSYQA